ncbi:MAG: TIGR03545 family protein [Nautiliaceae bacterium]
MGDFVFSFFKELNSASSKNMIALAVVLGLISGFLPTFTPINYFILFTVFIFRIPLGLYFASFGIFSLISYLIDFIFNKIGYWLLTNELLEPFWTFLYNFPFMRWSGFNNTLVLGSLITGIVIGVIVYIFLIKSIDYYRKTVFPRLKKIKYISWIVPKEEKKGIFRISGLIAFGVISGIVSLFMVIFLDPIVKGVLEFALSKSIHKKVEIEKVTTKIFEPSIEILNMRVDKILVKKMFLNFNKEYIVWKKFDIKNLLVDAKSDISIYKYIKKTSNVKKNSVFMPEIYIPKAEDIFASMEFESLKKIEILKKDFEKVKKEYSSQSLEDINKKIKELKIKSKQLKHSNPAQMLTQIKELKKEIEFVKKEIENKKKQLISSKDLLQNDIKEIKEALNRDYQKIDEKYKMVKNGEYVKFVESFLKPQIQRYINYGYEIYKKIEPYINKKEEKKVEITRKGIYIKFQDKIKYPDFVLEKSNLSFYTPKGNYFIKSYNISDNQTLLNKKGVINLKADDKYYYGILNVDYLKDITFKGEIKKGKFKKLSFPSMDILDLYIKGNFNGIILNENINSRVNVKVINGCFVYKKDKTDIDKILKNILKSVHKFNLFINIKGNLKNPQIHITSDLDKLLSKAIMEILQKNYSKELLKAKKKLNNAVNNSLKQYNADFLVKNIKNLKNKESMVNLLMKELIKNNQNSIFKSLGKFF